MTQKHKKIYILWLPLLNSVHYKFPDWSKLKAFVDDKLIVTQVMMSFIDWEENTVGKGENAVYQHFLLFPVFSKVLSPWVVKRWDCPAKD